MLLPGNTRPSWTRAFACLSRLLLSHHRRCPRYSLYDHVRTCPHVCVHPALSARLLERDLSEAYLWGWHDTAKRAALRRVLAYQGIQRVI